MRYCHILALLAFTSLAVPADALRANLRQDLARLEEMGHYEDALFYRRSTMDMILAVHVAWSGAPYDPAMDALFFETRTDRRYWNMVNGQKRPITDLLKKANLNPEQLAKLDERVRVYVEDHMSPDYDEMGNFYFRRKAWVMERLGLFLDASYRRRLTGYYYERVCAHWYATTAAELKRQGSPLAVAYAERSRRALQQAQAEYRRSDGDRLLAQLQGADNRSRLAIPQVRQFLVSSLTSPRPDARFAAALALVDLGDSQALSPLLNDSDPAVREIALDASQPAAPPPGPGLKPGLVADYFTSPDQQAPVARAILPAPDIGFRGNERFPDKLRAGWQKPDVVPAGATGQFLVRFQGKLLIPEPGQYRFYVKTDGINRAVVRIAAKGSDPATIISPRNDRQLLYSVQTGPAGEVLTRVDFSDPIQLPAGLLDLLIEYKGPEVKGKQDTAGLRFSWSSEKHVMEPVPASACYHQSP